MRKSVLELLRGGKGRLYDEHQQGGFRDERHANRALLVGPDFGAEILDRPVYLPAHKRYTGRFFEELNALKPDFWEELPRGQVEVLFVSGLYGLLCWDELIQEYDCHLGDYRVSDGKRIGELWKPVLTPVLADFLKAQATAGHPIRYIYDFLSEEVYLRVVDWDKISSQGVRLHHRVFQGVAGPDILSWVARILATQLPRFLDSEQRYRNGVWIECRSDHGQAVKFSFESRVGEEPLATREGDLHRAEHSILGSYPHLKTLPDQVFKDLVLAEHSWSKVEALDQFDFGAVILSFTKSVERYLQAVVPNCPLDVPLGECIGHVQRLPGWAGLCGDLRGLNRLRVAGGAHPGQRSKKDLRRARQLALRILVHGELLCSGRLPRHG